MAAKCAGIKLKLPQRRIWCSRYTNGIWMLLSLPLLQKTKDHGWQQSDRESLDKLLQSWPTIMTATTVATTQLTTCLLLHRENVMKRQWTSFTLVTWNCGCTWYVQTSIQPSNYRLTMTCILYSRFYGLSYIRVKVLRPTQHKIVHLGLVPKPILWLGMEKLNLGQQKHTFINQKKCTATQARFSRLLRPTAWKWSGSILKGKR